MRKLSDNYTNEKLGADYTSDDVNAEMKKYVPKINKLFSDLLKETIKFDYNFNNGYYTLVCDVTDLLCPISVGIFKNIIIKLEGENHAGKIYLTPSVKYTHPNSGKNGYSDYYYKYIIVDLITGKISTQ